MKTALILLMLNSFWYLSFRFHQSVSVSELYQMKDVIEISDMEGSGRMVNLLHRYRDSPAPHDSSDIEVCMSGDFITSKHIVVVQEWHFHHITIAGEMNRPIHSQGT